MLSLYKECENFLRSSEYTQEIRNEVEESIPNCLTVLQKWINDLENSDHGIVIAGKLRNKFMLKRLSENKELLNMTRRVQKFL